jgi:putative transposase
VIEKAKKIRIDQPRIGARKLQKEIYSEQTPIGRDSLFKLLKNKDMLVSKKKKYCRTTYSNHPYAVALNRVKTLEIVRPNQVWVSDITYISLGGNHAYLFLTTDLFSRKIVGYHLSKDLSHHSALIALDMALSNIKKSEGIIHHSDRGCQYCCHEFIAFLNSYQMIPSMTAESHCYENAHAERVNGILKSEFNLDARFDSFASAQQAVEKSISIYNNKRFHWSLKLRTPADVYSQAA